MTPRVVRLPRGFSGEDIAAGVRPDFRGTPEHRARVGAAARERWRRKRYGNQRLKPMEDDG